MATKRKILVFGGSFNPPTLAHEAIIAACLGLPQFDKVWLMPSGDRLDKTIPTESQHRLAMLEAVKTHVFSGDRRLVITDFELKLPRPTKTYLTAKALAAMYPDFEFWWAFGADSFRSMPEWENGQKLKKELNIVIFGEDRSEFPDQTFLELPSSLATTSSTRARQAIARGDYQKAEVSEPIRAYIKSNNLYK